MRVAHKTDNPERLMQMVAGRTPMQRLGTAADVYALGVVLLIAATKLVST